MTSISHISPPCGRKVVAIEFTNRWNHHGGGNWGLGGQFELAEQPGSEREGWQLVPKYYELGWGELQNVTDPADISVGKKWLNGETLCNFNGGKSLLKCFLRVNYLTLCNSGKRREDEGGGRGVGRERERELVPSLLLGHHQQLTRMHTSSSDWALLLSAWWLVASNGDDVDHLNKRQDFLQNIIKVLFVLFA